jgi:hypothetical protein
MSEIGTTAAESDDDEIQDTIGFFRFSHISDHPFTGAVVFHIDQHDTHIVDVDPQRHDHKVIIYTNQEAKDALSNNLVNVKCTVSADKDSFLKVYKGEIKAYHALLARKIVVHGMGFRELQRFVSAFDFSTPNWNRYYAWKDQMKVNQLVEDGEMFAEDDGIDVEFLETLEEQKLRLFGSRFLEFDSCLLHAQKESSSYVRSSFSTFGLLPFGLSSYIMQMQLFDLLDSPNRRIAKAISSFRRWSPYLYQPIHQDLAEQLALNVFSYTNQFSKSQIRFDLQSFEDNTFGFFNFKRISEAFIRRRMMPFLIWYSKTLDPSDVSMG